MDLIRHLRYFVMVAEELHFGRAARRLHMAQPPLSQRIRRLEQEYGTPLFDRSGGQVRLTPAGEALRAEAAEIIARVDRSLLIVRRAAGWGTLRAGVPPQTPGRTLAALSTAAATALPDVSLELREATTTEQVNLLASGDLDVGLLQLPVDADDLVFGPEVALAPGVVLPRVSPLAEQTEVDLAELAGQQLVLFPRSTAPGCYDETLALCRRHGFDPVGVLPVLNPEFLVGLVAAGQGVAFDQGVTAQKESRVVWRPLTGRPLVWRMAAAWSVHSGHTEARRFAELAARVLASDAPQSERSATPPEQAGPRPWSVVFGPRPPEADDQSPRQPDAGRPAARQPEGGGQARR